MFGDYTSSETERYIVDVALADVDAEQRLFVGAIRWALEHGAANILVVVSTMDNVRNLARALGRPAADALAKRRSVAIGDGVTLNVASKRTLGSRYSITGPIVVPWASNDLMREVDAKRSPAIFAKPWLDTDLVEWKANWSPVDVSTGRPIASGPAISDPVVEQAMISISDSVNLNYPFGHPHDKAMIVQGLKALRDHGHEADPGEIRAWAVNHRWSPDHAKELEAIAQKVRERRSIRNGDRALDARRAIEGWRERAAAQRR